MTETIANGNFSLKIIDKSRVRYKKILCADPNHDHKNPEIEMWGVDYMGYWIEITKQDGRVNVRVDEDNSTVEKFRSFKKAFEYVDKITRR